MSSGGSQVQCFLADWEEPAAHPQSRLLEQTQNEVSEPLKESPILCSQLLRLHCTVLSSRISRSIVWECIDSCVEGRPCAVISAIEAPLVRHLIRRRLSDVDTMRHRQRMLCSRLGYKPIAFLSKCLATSSLASSQLPHVAPESFALRAAYGTLPTHKRLSRDS